MARVPNSIGITGPIAPIDAADRYPTHFSRYGWGGYYTVSTFTDLSLISQERLGEGEPLVYVLDENVFYMWIGGQWRIVDFSNGQSPYIIIGEEIDGDTIIDYTYSPPVDTTTTWFMDNINFLSNNIFT